MITQQDKYLLASIIVENILQDFYDKHLTGNLMDSIVVEEVDGKVRVVINAPTYNMLEYFRTKTIIHTGHGSYASKLDREGSSFFAYKGETRKGSYRIFPGNHKNYIETAIQISLQQWKNLMQKDMSLKKWGDVDYGNGTNI